MILRHRRLAVVASTVAAFALAASGCSATQSSGAPAAGTTDIKSLVEADAKGDFDALVKELGSPKAKADTNICYVTRTLYEYWAFVSEGVKKGAEAAGAQSLVVDVSSEAGITEQLDKAKSTLANKNCAAMLASPISATSLNSVYTDGLNQGKPAIIVNDAKGTLAGTVYVGPDSVTTGELAAEYVAGKLPDGGKVAMVEGDPGSSNAQARGKGFKQGLEKHPNLKLVASQSAAGWDATKAQDIATTMLKANPDIKAFYSHNDGMAIGIAAAIKQAGLTGKVLLVGTDGIPQAKKLIQAGTMTATVSQKPQVEGTASVNAALWLIEGKKVPSWVVVPAFVVDKENVAEYAEGMP